MIMMRLPLAVLLFFSVSFIALTWLALQGTSSSFKTLTTLESPLRDMQWIGPSDEIVFTLTEEGHVWTSKDGGVTWTDDTEKLPGAMDTHEVHGVFEAPKGVIALHFHQSAPGKIFMRGGANTHWITMDYGETYKKVEGPDGFLGINTLRLHPTEIGWILVMVRRWACWDREEKARRHCADDLFVTKDFGQTWANLTHASQGRILGFVDFDWGISAKMDKKDGVLATAQKPETVVASVYENRKEVREHLEVNGMGVVTGWDQYVDFVRTTDLFHSQHIKSVPCGNQFEVMNGVLFLAVADHCGQSAGSGRGGVRLKASTNYGLTFSDACFSAQLVERGYSVVHVADSSVFINVDYSQGNRVEPYGDLLVSDSSLRFYALSMHRNARSLGGTVDFVPVQGIPGVYIANQLSDYDVTPQGQGAGSDDEPMGFAKSTTVISFDGGARWLPIMAPEYDSNRKKIECGLSEGCSLHLHGSTSWVGGGGFAFVYSHASTPGIIISTGNVGQYLYQDSTVNTYLSRDAGQTWEEIAKGSHIYEFGDSGGVIIMTRHGLHTATSSVLYSLDEGLTWETVQFAPEDEPVDIFNIRVEPDNQGKKFIIQGLTVDDGSARARKAILITLDFSRLEDYKTCERSDYEDWQPTVERCILGTNITLQRQKRSSKCWNGETYEHPSPRVEVCTCGPNDFQCDFGTELAPGGDSCEPITGFNYKSCPEIKSNGYKKGVDLKRKMAGDVCLPAPSAGGGKSSWFHKGGGGRGGAGGIISGGGKAGASESTAHASPETRPAPPLKERIEPPPPSSPAVKVEEHYSSHHEGGGWGWVETFAVMLVVLGVLLGGFTYLASQGVIPDEVLQRIPFLERLRYQNLRSNFQSLANDYGVAGGDDEYEEMYRRP